MPTVGEDILSVLVLIFPALGWCCPSPRPGPLWFLLLPTAPLSSPTRVLERLLLQGVMRGLSYDAFYWFLVRWSSVHDHELFLF